MTTLLLSNQHIALLHKQFQQIGTKLFLRGLNNSHSGNISVRVPSSGRDGFEQKNEKNSDKIIITGTGKMLDELTTRDLVAVEFVPTDSEESAAQDRKASMELLVHRAIYHADESIGAVVHAHAPYAVAAAVGKKEVVPYDQEGAYFFQSIPILHAQKTIASTEVAEKIGQYVTAARAVIVAKHGVFAWGKTLEEAYHFLLVVESACRINYLVEVKQCCQEP